jgi:flagellar motor switch protein FliN/FliY
MSEEPSNREEQLPATPAQPKQSAEMSPASAGGEAGAAGVKLPANRSTGASVADNPAGAATPAEPHAGDEASAAGKVTASAEEVEATIEELLSEETSAASVTPTEADAEGATSATADDVKAVVAGMPDAAVQESSATASTPTSTAEGTPELPPDARVFEPEDFAFESQGSRATQLDLLDDVELDVKVELGRTEMYIEDVLGLGAGSVVALDKAAGDPVDIFVNERLVARGEVLVLNDNFCVRINDIISPVPELEDGR